MLLDCLLEFSHQSYNDYRSWTYLTWLYPEYEHKYYPVLPYYIPLRAMTNPDIDNMMPISKTMAQSFLVNATVRLHPVEFPIDQVAGTVSAYVVQNNLQKVANIYDE